MRLTLPHTWTFPYCPDPGGKMDWESVIKDYPSVLALKGVPQDPIFHAEGDVFVHTRMVIERLIEMEAWRSLEPTERAILMSAALLHDIGKFYCTKKEGNKIIAPRHAIKGAKVARAFMYRGNPIPVPFPIREYIFQLICHHGVPLWAWERQEVDQSLRSISEHIRLDHLALLAEADVRGRVCKDQEDLLVQVDFFRELAEKAQCYEHPFPFPSSLARFTYFHKIGTSPLYDPYDDTEFEVILLSGLPGSGKNSWITKQFPHLPSVCLDDIRQELRILPIDNQGRVLQLAKERAKEFLRRKQSFVWNATNLIRLRRKALVDLFITYKAKVKIIYLECTYQELLARNQKREVQVPLSVLERFVDRIEIPEQTEAHEVEYWIS